MNEWKDIKSCPKDGTKFIGWVNDEWIEGFTSDGESFWWASDGDGPSRKDDFPKFWKPWPVAPEVIE